METRKSRGSIRPLSVNSDISDVKTQLKRRISFSGKNTVRIFSGEEKPKTWNNSYEISDSHCGTEVAVNCVPHKTKKLQKCRDLSNGVITENFLICQIENSVDITLSEVEKKFQIAKFKNNETAYSYSLEDNEKDDRSIQLVEKTIDFMKDLNESNEVVNNLVISNFEDAKVPMTNKYMDEHLNITKLEAPIEISPKSNANIHKNGFQSLLGTNFKQSIHTPTSKTNGAITNVSKPCSTIYCNQSVEISPAKLGTTLDRLNLSQPVRDYNIDEVKKKSHSTRYLETLNVIGAFPENTLQASPCCETLNGSRSIPKCELQKTIAVRKICNKNINKTKNILEWEKLKLDRYKQKQTKHMSLDDLRDNSKNIVEMAKQTKTNTCLSFSLNDIENIAMLETSFLLMPIEYKWDSLKQLHDEIERGNIKNFSNAPKTFLTNQMKCNNSSILQVQSGQPALHNRRTLLFEDEAMAMSEDTLCNKPNNFLHFNTTVEGYAKGRKSNINCRYPQVDDVVWDNTSFFTNAKLGDETVSCNNSKEDISQIKDGIFNHSLPETANNLEEYTLRSDVEMQKTCNREDYRLSSSMFENVKPIEDTKNFRKSGNFYNDIDNIRDMTIDSSANLERNLCSSKSLLPKTEEGKKIVRQTLYFDRDIVESDLKSFTKSENAKDQRSISNESAENSEHVENICSRGGTNSINKTMFFEEYTIKFHNSFKEKLNTVEQIANAQNNDFRNINPTRKTLFLNKEISLDSLSKEIELNNEKSDVVNMAIVGNTVLEAVNYKNNSNSTYNRKTYFNNVVPLQERSNSIQKANIQTNENFVYHESVEPSNSTNSMYKDSIKMVENIPFHEGLESSNFVNSFHEFQEPPNSAKVALLHQPNKSKLSNILDNSLITPKKTTGGKKNSLLCMTPRLSLLEFTSLESKIKEECETNYKRSSFTLTPVRSMIKKRHTLMFGNFPLKDSEESKRNRGQQLLNKGCEINDGVEISGIVSNESFAISVNKSPVFGIDNNNYINNHFKNEDAMETSGIASHESIISIPIKKSDYLIDISNNNHNIISNLDMNAENIAESIQLIRTAGFCSGHGITNINDPSSPKYNVISEKIENVQMNERIFRSNYYGDTFGNEESFILPKLPPTPHMRLNLLRNLLERHTIMDDVVFWEHEGFNSTTAMSYDDAQSTSNSSDEARDEYNAVTNAIKTYQENMLSFEMNVLKIKRKVPSASKLPFVLRLDVLLRNNSINWIYDYQMQHRGILLFTHKKTSTLVISLSFEELDNMGNDVRLQSIKVGKSNLPKKNWKPIDYFLECQLKFNLPYNLNWLLKGNNEVDIFNMLKKIDQLCLKTLKMGNILQRICYTKRASIIRDGSRTCVRKIVREIVNNPNNGFKYVNKTVIIIELLNLNTLNFKNILIPRLHHFQERIHLLPTGLEFLQQFLPDPTNYLNIV